MVLRGFAHPSQLGASFPEMLPGAGDGPTDLLPGSRRLDRCVQGQQLGLVRHLPHRDHEAAHPFLRALQGAQRTDGEPCILTELQEERPGFRDPPRVPFRFRRRAVGIRL